MPDEHDSRVAVDCGSNGERPKWVRAARVAPFGMLWLAIIVGSWVMPNAPLASAAGPTHGKRNPSQIRTHAREGSKPTVVVSMARWDLPEPLSRAGAVPLSGNRVLLVGGLLASDTSSSEVAVLDIATGKVTRVATLPSPTHDAGIAELDGRAFVFGGGQSVPSTVVQAVTLASSEHGGSPGAVVTGYLPQARSDDDAVTVGGTAYVVGGYDGSAGDAAVLATTNGAEFSLVATLPVAVRYPAVTASNRVIYLFGGESEQGGTTTEYSTPAGSTTPPPGQQVAVVQAIDTRTHVAKVVGSLPHALEGAAAFTFDGHIFLAGGDSNAPGSAPSSGSTVWSFDPSNDSFHVAGHLAAPVSYAAVVVEGRTVWLVGGERNGVQVSSAQRVTLRSRR